MLSIEIRSVKPSSFNGLIGFELVYIGLYS